MQGRLWLQHLSSQVNIIHTETQEMAEHLPADRTQWLNSLFCFACMQLLLNLLNCVHLNPQVLPVFYFLPILQERGVSEQLGRSLVVGQRQPITPTYMQGIFPLFTQKDCLITTAYIWQAGLAKLILLPHFLEQAQMRLQTDLFPTGITGCSKKPPPIN